MKTLSEAMAALAVAVICINVIGTAIFIAVEMWDAARRRRHYHK